MTPPSLTGMQVKPQGLQVNDERIDVDGLPHVGAVVYPSQAYYSKVDCATGDILFRQHFFHLQRTLIVG